MNKNDLLEILSNGEKKALYLLNIIYEVEARRLDQKPVLIIIDDIADSFDYQNKYAIIEYLNDIRRENFFKLIILTHNFDFYRTVGSRLSIHRRNCYMIQKNENCIKLVRGEYLKDVFAYWKTNVNKDYKILIASIPFVRNLVEYKYSTAHANYTSLTKLLHMKGDTKNIKLNQLTSIYKDIWNINLDFSDENKEIYDLIFEEADSIISENGTQIKLENKIVLSIAIRLLAEDFMISRIQDQNLVNGIESNQTRKLYEIFKDENNSDVNLKYLEKVNLMTPENIHLNSFMYEPILDMQDSHLKNLYENIKNMTP